MAGLNIRSFAKVETTDSDMAAPTNNQTNGSRQQQAENDSDDSDEGIQYLAPDQTPSGKYNLESYSIHWHHKCFSKFLRLKFYLAWNIS